MHDFNRRFDFVAMLSAGTTVPSSANKTLLQQLFIGKRSRMKLNRDTFHREVTTTWIRSFAGIRYADPDDQSVAETVWLVEQSGCRSREVARFQNANAGAPSWCVSISRLTQRNLDRNRNRKELTDFRFVQLHQRLALVHSSSAGFHHYDSGSRILRC